MLVHALRGAGLEPGWLIGGTVGDGLPTPQLGRGEWLVVEADESDRSMLELDVEIAVLTNVELDHHAAFGSLAELRGAFRGVSARAACASSGTAPELLELRDGPVWPYEASELTLTAGGSRFLGASEVRLAVPGAHNAARRGRRAAGRGAGRRRRRAGRRGAGRLPWGRAALSAARLECPRSASTTTTPTTRPRSRPPSAAPGRSLEHSRLVAVFQPHLYSRTALLAREFGVALALADVVVVLDVYPARERAEDHPGVSGLLIAEGAADAAAGRPVYWLPSIADAAPVSASCWARAICAW